MNRITRLTALLLALMMILSTFAAADTAYQVGGMTQEQWNAIVENAQKELFTTDEGDSGKVVEPPIPEVPAPGPYHPYTDGTTIPLTISEEPVASHLTPSGVAVLTNSDAGQWQISINGAWVNITGETGDNLWVTAAMMNGMPTADFRKALGEKDAETGEYTTFSQTATVTLVESNADSWVTENRDDGIALAAENIPVTPAAESGVYSLERANEDLQKYIITINYLFASNGAVAADPYFAELGNHTETFSAVINHPSIVGYQPDNAAEAVDSNGEPVEWPEEFAYDTTKVTISDVAVEGDITINVYYVPAMVTYKVKYYQEMVKYETDPETGELVKYELVDTIQETGLTDSTIVSNSGVTSEDGVQYYAPKDKYPGFLPLLYDENMKIAADSSTAVNVYYQRLYYLLSLNLGGGYGVDPVYDKYGARIDDVGEPERAGYAFKGWTRDKDATVYGANYDNSKIEALPENVPAENRIYYAVWEPKKVAYTVVYWRENANDNGYSFWGSRKFDGNNEMVLAGSTLNYTDNIHAIPASITTVTINNETVNEANFFTRNTMLTDKDVVVKGDGTTILNVYYYRNTYTLYFDANGTMTGRCVITPHNHGDGTCTQELICHIHGDDCVENLICRIEEHVHSAEECGTTLKCGKTAHAQHTTNCYEGVGNVVGNNNPEGTEPSNPQEGQVYVYEEDGRWGTSYIRYVYINGRWYRLQNDSTAENGSILYTSCHRHSELCYTFNCNKVEHKHVEPCYTYTCPEADHEHTKDCYRPCTKPTVHTHNDSCNRDDGKSNVIHAITAKYNADIVWPEFEGIASWRDVQNANNNASLIQSSKVLTLTHTFCKSNTFTIYAFSGQYTYALNYMFESFDQESDSDNTSYMRRDFEGVIYDRNEDYSEIADYGDTSGWGYKVIDGFTKAVTGNTNAEVKENVFEDLKADKVVFLYYKRNRWTLSYYNHSTDKDPQLWDDDVMFDQPLDGYVIDGNNINEYEPADNYYPADLEEGAYYFDGWYTTPECFDGTEFDPETAFMPNGDLNIYGKWSPVKHKVTVYNTPEDAEAGTATPLYNFVVNHNQFTSSAYTYDNPDHINPDGSFNEPQAPDNGEWEFVGWFFVKDGKEIGFSFLGTPITEDTVVYAKWQANKVVKYTIYYVLDDGVEGTYNIEESNWVAGFKEGSGLAGYDVTEDAKGGTELYATPVNYQEGYFPTLESHSFELSLDETNNVYVFEYVQKDAVPYKVLYLDKETGKELHEAKIVENNRKAVVTENYVAIGDNYVPELFQQRKVLKANSSIEENVIIFYYTKDETRTTLEVNHYTISYGQDPVLHTSNRQIVSVDPVPYQVDVEPREIPNYAYNATLTTRSDGGNTPYHTTQLEFELRKGASGVVLNLYYVELPVTIKYQVAPMCTDMGEVSLAEETIGIVTGVAAGSTAKAAENYKFDGWYSDESCTQLVSQVEDFVPDKVNGLNVAATYYAKFKLDVADLTITKAVNNSDDGTTAPAEEFTVKVKLTNAVGPYTYTSNKPDRGGTLNLTNGEGTLSIVAGETIVIKGIVIGTQYVVTEEELPYYTEVVDQKGQTAIAAPTGSNNVVEITNTYLTGCLTITKNVVGATAPADEFTFTVNLSEKGSPYSYTKPDGTPSTVAYNGTITLKDGEAVTITGIPAGTEYSVTETANDKYTTTQKGETGMIASGKTAEAVFTNTYKFGDLCIGKRVEPKGEDGKTFTFTLELSDQVNKYNYIITDANGTTRKEGTAGNSSEFTLQDEWHFTLKDIPDGTTFKVVETLVSGYATYVSEDGEVDQEDGNTNIAEGKITAGNTKVMRFVNVYGDGSLNLIKTVVGHSAPEDDFQFTISLKDEFDENLFGVFPLTIIYDDAGTQKEKTEQVDTSKPIPLQLKSGWSALIVGLPEGTHYTIEETVEEDYVTTVRIDTVETADTESGMQKNVADGVIPQTGMVQVEFINTYQYSTLTIEKTGKMQQGETAIFQVTNADKSVTYTIPLTVNADGYASATIANLPLHSEWTVTELTDWTWRYTSTVVSASSTVTIDLDGETVTFNNELQNEQWLDHETHVKNEFNQKSSGTN